MEYGTEGAEGLGWQTKTIEATVWKMLGELTLSNDKHGQETTCLKYFTIVLKLSVQLSCFLNQ